MSGQRPEWEALSARWEARPVSLFPEEDWRAAMGKAMDLLHGHRVPLKVADMLMASASWRLRLELARGGCSDWEAVALLATMTEVYWTGYPGGE